MRQAAAGVFQRANNKELTDNHGERETRVGERGGEKESNVILKEQADERCIGNT